MSWGRRHGSLRLMPLDLKAASNTLLRLFSVHRVSVKCLNHHVKDGNSSDRGESVWSARCDLLCRFIGVVSRKKKKKSSKLHRSTGGKTAAPSTPEITVNLGASVCFWLCPPPPEPPAAQLTGWRKQEETEGGEERRTRRPPAVLTWLYSVLPRWGDVARG